jgi:hypothetical protein
MGYYWHAGPPPDLRVLDDTLYAEWVASGNPKAEWWTLIPDPPGPNYRWDGTQWVEIPPPPPEPLTRLGFLSRFEVAELVGIEVARQTASQVQQRATLAVLKESWMAANDIDVTDQRTIDGVTMLVTMSLLTAERAAVILAPPQ